MGIEEEMEEEKPILKLASPNGLTPLEMEYIANNKFHKVEIFIDGFLAHWFYLNPNEKLFVETKEK